MMKNRILILFVSLFVMTSINAQSITGKWKTIDDDTGKEKSVVEIYKKDGKYYGKVISIVDPKKRDKKCER